MVTNLRRRARVVVGLIRLQGAAVLCSGSTEPNCSCDLKRSQGRVVQPIPAEELGGIRNKLTRLRQHRQLAAPERQSYTLFGLPDWGGFMRIPGGQAEIAEGNRRLPAG
jgi:hypothetical protein